MWIVPPILPQWRPIILFEIQPARQRTALLNLIVHHAQESLGCCSIHGLRAPGLLLGRSVAPTKPSFLSFAEILVSCHGFCRPFAKAASDSKAIVSLLTILITAPVSLAPLGSPGSPLCPPGQILPWPSRPPGCPGIPKRPLGSHKHRRPEAARTLKKRPEFILTCLILTGQEVPNTISNTKFLRV